MDFQAEKQVRIDQLNQLNQQKNILLNNIRAIEEEMLMVNGEIRLLSKMESEPLQSTVESKEE